ncbi:ERV/ALR sulfhydryl oxidase domain-containing protein [Sporodiniella umbellata]|nr:ERV/ALR sulfhydryl oxidase domain-containing protein [Sporodiniella umbellata]
MIKRLEVVSTIVLIVLVFTSILLLYSKQGTSILNLTATKSKTTKNEDPQIIMNHMTNQTERAELGRATWKFLHTMMAKYPEKPTQNERETLHDFVFMFSRLYPCGECARHFNLMITQNPPQTSSRSAASQWLCAMHNKVNERLGKPIFDCSNIESKYPCGCAEEENNPKKQK